MKSTADQYFNTHNDLIGRIPRITLIFVTELYI